LDLLAEGGTISVQVLNEFTNVARKKWRRDWAEIAAALQIIRLHFNPIVPVTLETHQSALELASRDGLSFYDALIVAAAIEAGCDVLFSEDLQHGRMFGKLVVNNPFRIEA
jgi:predicted nucleic acid-binding protein